MTFQEAVCVAEAQVRHDRHDRLVHAAEVRRAVQGRRRRSVADVLVHRGRRRSGRRSGDGLDRPCRACGSRTTSAARSIRRSCAARSKAASTWALGEALMEEQAFRRLPARLSHALVHKFPSMLEYKSPTSLDMPEIFTDLIEHPDPAGPFGAKEVGQGPLLPIMPAVANAVLRRGRRAHRRDADHAGEDPARARGEGRRQAGARTDPAAFPDDRLARAAARHAAVGRRRRPRVERAGAQVGRARPTPASKRTARRCAHDAPAALPLSRAAHDRGGGGMARRSRRPTRCCSPAAPIWCRT